MNKIFKLIKFSFFYVGEVVKTNIIMAYEVLTPTHYMKPGYIKINVSELSDRQLLIFSNLLTMTPGSMVVSVDDKSEFVYIHLLYLEDRNVLAKEIRENYLNRVKEVF